MATERPLSPHLQVYRWQITMLLSIMHRATGVLLAIGILLLTAWLAAAADGPQSHTLLRDLLQSAPGLLVLVGIVFAFFFHLCNGVRHLFWDAGLGFEKKQYYGSGWAVIVVSVLLTVAAALLATGIVGGQA